jgi:hypothetical protein
MNELLVSAQEHERCVIDGIEWSDSVAHGYLFGPDVNYQWFRMQLVQLVMDALNAIGQTGYLRMSRTILGALAVNLQTYGSRDQTAHSPSRLS